MTMTINQQQIKHFNFLQELLAFDGEIITDEMVERLKEECQCLMVMVNDKPYRKPDHYLVKVYLNFCHSKPVLLYITKEGFDYIHGWNDLKN